MHYFNAVFTTFLGLESFIDVENCSDFITNILICVTKMNKGLTGLERHKREDVFFKTCTNEISGKLHIFAVNPFLFYYKCFCF